MNERNSVNVEGEFVELPTGIFTAAGVWFHTSESFVREFAGPVVDRVGMGALLSQAGSWLRSADTAAALCLIFALLLSTPAWAVAISIVVYLSWSLLIPVLVFPSVIRMFSVLSAAWIQGLVYVLVLSWLGTGGFISAVVIGLFGFVLFRWGVVRSLLDRLMRPPSASNRSLPTADRVLRSLLVRYAISFRITLPSTEEFENRILEIWERGNKS